MHDRFERDRQVDVVADEVLGYAAAKPALPAAWIEAQQMIAIFCRFADPQLADHAAFGKNILHSKGLLTFIVTKPSLCASSLDIRRT